MLGIADIVNCMSYVLLHVEIGFTRYFNNDADARCHKLDYVGYMQMTMPSSIKSIRFYKTIEIDGKIDNKYR